MAKPVPSIITSGKFLSERSNKRAPTGNADAKNGLIGLNVEVLSLASGAIETIVCDSSREYLTPPQH